jgi:hypothetical protein
MCDYRIALWCLLAGSLALPFQLAGQNAAPTTHVPPGVEGRGSSFIDCNEASLIAAVAKANANNGGLITFNCSNLTIPIRASLGILQNGVVVDGQDRHITLEFMADFTGCLPGDNGIKGQPIARLRGESNVVRNLTFRNFLESLQISGPNNLVEHNRFYGHICSDDAVSTIRPTALNTVVRGNHFENYSDKAFQLSYGGGIVEGNTFVDTAQPIRSPYDNTSGSPVYIRQNTFKTNSSDHSKCNGPHIDGRYIVFFEDNQLECRRGLRVGGRTEVVVRNNSFIGNRTVGLEVREQAVASVSENVISDNGLSPGSTPPGGVVILDSARVDLGGGSASIGGRVFVSPGKNRIQGNNTFDVRNLSNATVSAKHNCWDHSDPKAVRASDLEGDVEVEPLGMCSK